MRLRLSLLAGINLHVNLRPEEFELGTVGPDILQVNCVHKTAGMKNVSYL